MKIPFCKIPFGDEEKEAINRIIDSGWIVMGEKTEEFEEKFAKYVGAKYAIFVDSCTSALFLCLKWRNVEKVKVGVPSLTFTATAEAIVNVGGIPVFLDVNKETFCVDNIENTNTYTSVIVNLTGNKAKYNHINGIYDSAHRIEKDDVKNSNQDWCYSFYATKNITTIQGGMIATNNEEAALWYKKARDHGISKGTEERYKKGQWEYSVDFIGWRMKADDVRAAIGIEQLKKIDWITKERNYVVKRYNELLDLNRTGNHLYPILVENRFKFIRFMQSKDIQVSVHFLPLHKMKVYKKYLEYKYLPNTDYLGDKLVSLPLYPTLKEIEIEYIAEAVQKSKLLIKE